MNKLYRIKPENKKSIHAIYHVYKDLPDGSSRQFSITELYRWGQGFRTMDNPVYSDDVYAFIDTNIGWGCELEDTISVDFEFDDSFTDEEKEEIENLWYEGDPEDPDGRSGPAWLYDVSDWQVEEDFVQITGPFIVDIVDENEYNVVIEENVQLQPRPKMNNWPF